MPSGSAKAKEFAEKLGGMHDRHILLALRGHPDPDAIASAMAHARIAARFGVNCTIGYCHEVSHRDNLALLKFLGSEMVRLDEQRPGGNHFDAISFVDTQGLDPALASYSSLEVFSVVDHHRPSGNLSLPFVDLRPDVGATSTIYTEYILELAPLDPADPEDAKLATALMHGLRTDTDDFSRARAVDFRAASYLAEFVDREFLHTISRKVMSPPAMEVVTRALSGLVVRRNFAIAGVGFLAGGDRDAIALAADFLLRREDIDTAIVYGVVDDQIIDGSLRTVSPALDPPSWLEAALGRDERGQAYGGGRREAGGFQIPIGFFGRVADRKVLWQLVDQTVTSSLLRQIGEVDESRKPVVMRAEDSNQRGAA